MVIDGFDFGPTVNMLMALWVPVFVTLLVRVLFVETRALSAKYGPVLTAFVNAHTSADERRFMADVARVGVLMAEQVAARQDIKDAAAAKQQAAFHYINSNLAAHGITMKADDVYALIEAAVYDELNRNRTAAPSQAEDGSTAK